MTKRNVFLILGITALVILVGGCSAGLKAPKIELSTNSFDLGDINPDNGKRVETFYVKNTGSDVLKILSVSTSCGCTEANVESEEINPGEQTKLTVTYDPSVHPDLVGKIKRVVYVQSNDPLNEEVELELIGNSLASGTGGENKEDEEHEDELKDFEVSPFQVYSKIKNKEPIKLLDVREDSEYAESHIEGTLLLSVNNINQEELDKLGLNKDDEIVVYCRSGRRSATAYDILKSLGYNNVKSMNGGIVHWMEEGFQVEEGDDKSTKDIGNVNEGPSIYIENKEYDLGEIRQYGGIVNTTFSVMNKGITDLKINSVSTSCGCTTAKLEDSIITPGSSSILTVFFDPNIHEEPEGKFSRTVFLETNDPNEPEAEVRIMVDILEGQ